MTDVSNRLTSEVRNGNERADIEGSLNNRLRYNAQMYDELSGLYYLRARYYNPSIGRFTQEDVIYNDGLNLYAYCNSNPVMYCDPSGFASSVCDPKTQAEGGNTWTRIDTIEDIANYGTNLGKDGQLFLTDLSALEGLDLTKKVHLAKAEQILGLPSGRLTNTFTIVQTEIDVSGLNVRLPSSGNEFFIPGGYTSGGAIEIVVDPMNIFNDNAVKSIKFFRGGD